MNVENLSYTEYTNRVAREWLKILQTDEGFDFHNLYDLLTAEGSDFFFYMSDIVSEHMGRAIDFLCYFLLLSVRTSDRLAAEFLDRAVEITKEVLEEVANEKRE